ncbi:hypothetical protein [Kitasatospora sp. GP82]|uniref:hypothetical protein n=1 Tax=Kitasatospora sp. GP82 TaxID=3035089 RepID=UPI002475484F|nr:hypothetical protein [Kitasatospora sp. GP82]MDH6128650.1 hypothetical protein [Kitasatospora sp. GP82]
MSVSTRLRATAVALCVAASSFAVAAVPAHAAAQPNACSWYKVGTSAGIWMNGEYVGEVEQQYNGCHQARAHWQWSYGYRTQAHPGTTGAWITVGLYGGVWAEFPGPQQGSSGSPDAYSPAVYIYYGGEDSWRASASLYTTWTNGSSDDTCASYTDEHDYTNGQSTFAAIPGTCSHSF